MRRLGWSKSCPSPSAAAGSRRASRIPSKGQQQPCYGRHCHSTLSLAAIACRSLRVGIYMIILLPLLSFSIKMTASPLARQQCWSSGARTRTTRATVMRARPVSPSVRVVRVFRPSLRGGSAQPGVNSDLQVGCGGCFFAVLFISSVDVMQIYPNLICMPV